MYLIIDECCGKKLAPIAEAQGHAAQRSIDIAELGRGAPDNAIFSFAASHGAAIVTINQGDFLNLWRRSPAKPGLILLPSLSGEALSRIFKSELPKISNLLHTDSRLIVRIEADGALKILPE